MSCGMGVVDGVCDQMDVMSIVTGARRALLALSTRSLASRACFVVLTCFLVFVPGVRAEPHPVPLQEKGPKIWAWLDRKSARVGEKVTLFVEVAGEAAADCSLGRIPHIKGAFVEKVSGPRVSVGPVPGDGEAERTQLKATFEITLIPQESGVLSLPAGQVSVELGKEYLSPSLSLTVSPHVTHEDAVSLDARPHKNRVYIFERVWFEMKILVRGELFRKIERVPEEELLSLPWLDSEPTFLSLQAAEPEDGSASRSIRVMQTDSAISFSFERTGQGDEAVCLLRARLSYIPSHAGTFTFPPSVYRAMPPGGNPVLCRSGPMIVEVMPLPETGKPRFFSNGVGRFEVVFEADPIDVKMGDPIRLLFSVEGEGNLEHLDMPRFSVLAESFRILGMEDRLEENRRWKAYLIAPSSPDVAEIPELAFSYFDPGKEEYVTSRWGPQRIVVHRGAVETTASDPEKAGSGAHGPRAGMIAPIMQDRDDAGFYGTSRCLTVVALCASAVVFFIAASVAAMRRRRSAYPGRARMEAAYGRLEEAIERLDGIREGDADDALARAFGRYIADRFSVPLSRIMAGSPGALLEKRGISAELAGQVESLFRKLDSMRYASAGGGEAGSSELVGKALSLAGRLDREASS